MSGASSRLDLLARRSLERARKLEWAKSATPFALRREGLGIDGDDDGSDGGSEHRRTVRTLYRDGLRAGRRLPDPCARHFVHNRLGEQFRRFRNLTSEKETDQRLREARRWTRRLRRCSYDDGDYIAVLERAYGLRGRMKHLIRACDVECAEGAPQKTKRPARFILPAVSERTGETFTLRYLFQTFEKSVEETKIDEKEKAALNASLEQQMRMLRLRVPRYFHPNGVVARVLEADSTEDERKSGEVGDENGDGDGDGDEGAAPIWMPADAVPGAILANVGDMLLRWTDGRYRSAPHRVLAPKTPGVDRHSVAFFLNCDVDAMVDARSLGLVKDGVEPKWPPITAMGYIEERVAATYSA